MSELAKEARKFIDSVLSRMYRGIVPYIHLPAAEVNALVNRLIEAVEAGERLRNMTYLIHEAEPWEWQEINEAEDAFDKAVGKAT